MMGRRGPSTISLLCNSRPFMPGICTSLITQWVSCKRPDFKNASADANWITAYPRDRMKLVVARRNESSSSTIATTGKFDNVAPPDERFSGNSLSAIPFADGSTLFVQFRRRAFLFRFARSPKSFDLTSTSAVINPSAASPRLSSSRIADAALGICLAKRQSRTAASSASVSMICKRLARLRAMTRPRCSDNRDNPPKPPKYAKRNKVPKTHRWLFTHLIYWAWR